MNYYVGVNGGNDKVQYAASAGYTKDGGIGINTDFLAFSPSTATPRSRYSGT